MLSKFVGAIIQPSHLIVWLGVISAVLAFSNRPRLARVFAAIATIVLVAFGFGPVGMWAVYHLENTYTRPAFPEHVDGVIVLSGGSNSAVLLSRGVLAPDQALGRLVTAYELSRRYPDARIVFTGGSGSTNPRALPETIAAQRILTDMGLAPARLTLEGKSRNTWENFVFTKAIVKPKPGETWLLATSAFHLPRSMAIAKRVGWLVVPWPTDYLTTRRFHYSPSDVLKNLQMADLAMHEYVGLLVYRLTGRSA